MLRLVVGLLAASVLGAGGGARSHVDTGRSSSIGPATRHDRLGGSWLGVGANLVACDEAQS
jgi:hypothetical protein